MVDPGETDPESPDYGLYRVSKTDGWTTTFENLPEIRNVDGDTGSIYELINDELSDLSLLIRPTFKMVDEGDFDSFVDKNDSLGPKELILNQLKDYDSEEVNSLAVELYNLLSKDNLNDAEELIIQFYKDNYQTKYDTPTKKEVVEEENEESPEDVQVTFDEWLE